MTQSLSVPVEEVMKIPLFHGLGRDDLLPLIEAAHEKHLLKGEFYFLQGDPAEYMYVLVRGRVKQYQCGQESKQALIRVIKPIHLFALVAMTPGNTYPVSAQATQDSTALYWSRPELMNFVLKVPQMALNAMRIMAEQLQEIQDRFRQVITQRAEQRLAQTLIRLAAQSGKRVQEGVLIDHSLTRQELAEISGTTQYTASRTLRQWRDKELVIAGRQKVIVRNPHGLMRIAEGNSGFSNHSGSVDRH